MITCECICQICGLPSAVAHDCDYTPQDMTWCEGPSHKDYSKLIHIDCGIYYADNYGDMQLCCKECAKEEEESQ